MVPFCRAVTMGTLVMERMIPLKEHLRKRVLFCYIRLLPTLFSVYRFPVLRKFIFYVIGASGKQGNNLPVSGSLPCFCIAMVFLRRRFTETIAALAIQHRARVIEHKIVFLPYMSGNFG